MARKLKGQGQTLSGSPSGTFSNFSPKPIQSNRAPTTADTGYEIGQLWADTNNTTMYGLSTVSAGSATWNLLGAGDSDVDTLTGDTGGAVSPAAGNINIVGGDGLTVAGAGSTLTINRDAAGGYPITPYVVGSSGEAGYTTIQAAITAANAAGGGVVYIQPGSYTEDLTLSDGVDLYGTPAVSQNQGASVTIIGTHTPPSSGHIGFNSIYFQDNSAVFSSAAAGSTHIVLLNCESAVQNGYFFDLVNWTGIFEIWDHNPDAAGAPFAVEDGGINNTGGATLFMFAAGFGFGTANTMNLSGTIVVGEADISCPVDFQTGSTIAIDVCQFAQPVTFSNNSTGALNTCRFSGGASAAITMSSSAAITIGQSVIESSNNPAIAGAGAGTLTLGTCNFTDNALLAGTLTAAYDTTVTGGVTSTGASLFDGGTFTVGSDNAANAIDIGGGTTARTIDIGSSAAAHVITIGSVTGAAQLDLLSGTGNFSVTGAATTNMTIGTGLTSGTITLGATGNTGTMTLSPSTSAQQVDIANADGAKTINLGAGVDGNTISIGNGINTSAQTVNISNGASAADSTVNILTGTATAGTQTLNLGSAASDTTLNVGTGAAVKTIAIGSTNTTSTTTINAGSGGVQVAGDVDLTTGSLQIEGGGQRLAVEGGAATDFIGQATLVAGTVTVANTNIAAADKVFVTREGVAASTALGVLDVSITASTSFTITALQPGTPGSTETNDVSIVNYFIVRQL